MRAALIVFIFVWVCVKVAIIVRHFNKREHLHEHAPLPEDLTLTGVSLSPPRHIDPAFVAEGDVFPAQS
jgi:hypothetical protein